MQVNEATRCFCALQDRATRRAALRFAALASDAAPLRCSRCVSVCSILSVGQTRYTKEHEWVRVTKEGEATIGITDFAQVQSDGTISSSSGSAAGGLTVAVGRTVHLHATVVARLIEHRMCCCSQHTQLPAIVDEQPGADASGTIAQ